MRNLKGTTLIEALLTVALFAIIFVAVGFLFTTVLSYWKITDARTDLQQRLNWTLQKVSLELQESGYNSAGVIQVAVLDNSGTNATDILRFAVPLCLCGRSPIDENGDVRDWGAPSIWGQSGCQEPWAVDGLGQTAICHIENNDPDDTTDMSVETNAVKSHLFHGDWIGTCSACDPLAYDNRTIEYLRDSGGRLMRRVLNEGGALVSESIMTEELSGYQAVIDAVDGTAALTMTMERTLSDGRKITASGLLDVLFRNRGGL